MTAHLYWRVFVETNNGHGTYIGIGELEMASTKGGANLCSGGTPIASGSHSSWTPEQAFDGTVAQGNAWLMNSPTNQWLGYQFATPVDIAEFRIYSTDETLSGVGSHIHTFRLEYSDDGVAWTTVNRYSQVGWADNELRVFDATPATYQHYRLLIDENNGASLSTIVELELFNTVAGNSDDLCTGGTVSSSSEINGSNIDDYAFDGSTVNKWTPVNPINEWVQYSLPTVASVKQYAITGCISGQETYAPKSFRLQASVDGVIWDTIDARTNETNWLASERRIYTIGVDVAEHPYTYNFLINPSPTYDDGILNNGVRVNSASNTLLGWSDTEGDGTVVECTMDSEHAQVGVIRVYFTNGVSTSGVYRPTSLYIIANDTTYQADLSGKMDYRVAPGQWSANIHYIDIPINDFVSSFTMGFTGNNWQMIHEIVVYDVVDPLATYHIRGTTVRGRNVPCSREIHVHDNTGAEVAITNSDPVTGKFDIQVRKGEAHYIRVIDLDGVYTPELRENIVPVEIDPV